MMMMMTMQWFMRRTFCCYATYMLHHKWYTITWWNNWCRHGASTWEEDGTHKSWRRSQKNGVGQLRLLFSCCLSLSFYAKKEERLSIAEEAGKRSLCFRAVSLETRPWEEKLTSKARKLSLLRKRSASHPHLACSSLGCPEPLFAFCFFDFRDWVSPFLFLRGNKAFSSVQQ